MTETEDAAAPLLSEPTDGLPDVVSTRDQLQAAAQALASGVGPVAIDAERASGHRYSQRAYLLQLRRAGCGTVLIDPTQFDGLQPLADAIGPLEWVLHSATQDLPCLASEGLRPTALFDTEVAAKLLNLPKVGLAALTESLLGWRLEKGFSAADWSKRPLPQDWLRYAALDVELLVELRNALDERLVAADRRAWADQEFAYLTTWQPTVRTQRWRSTSGIHRIKDRRTLAVARELWQSREERAERVDRPVGRVLRDDALIALAESKPRSREELRQIPALSRQRGAERWLAPVQRALDLPDDQLPNRGLAAGGIPPHKAWARIRPEAADRLGRMRAVVVRTAEQLNLPAEVLITPQLVRNLAWDNDLVADQIPDRLLADGARPWQVEQLGRLLAEALEATGG